MSTSRAGSSGPSSSSSSDFQPRSTSQARSSFHTLSHTPPGATAFDPTPWNMPTPSATPAPALARPRKISVASTDATVLGSFDAVAYTSNRSTVPPYQGQFIHPPFSRLPGGFSLGTEPMSYSVMHGHPTWFLDINDYITQNAEPPGAIQYPRDLEPPRLSQQRDMILRCTFCPRTYAGVNAKSMWIRHAREKHRLVLAKGRRGGPTSSRRQSESGGSPASSTPTPGNSTRSTAGNRLLFVYLHDIECEPL
ncbi:hypothetical protein C8F01DRAFT_105702 [Mycena amicta]|nr:hypothetical protein C8F01DRAFT_105702 [Mycena amicta]